MTLTSDVTDNMYHVHYINAATQDMSTKETLDNIPSSPRTAAVSWVVPVGNVPVLLSIVSRADLFASRPFSHQCCNRSHQLPRRPCRMGPWYTGCLRTLQTDHTITVIMWVLGTQAASVPFKLTTQSQSSCGSLVHRLPPYPSN